MSREAQIPSQATAERLHSAAIHLLRKLRREDQSGSLNAPRLSALSVIVFGGPITLGDLAAAEQVRPPTMTRIVCALEQQGLVVRRKNAEDGRSVYLSATAAGKRLLLESRRRRIRALIRQIDALAGAEQSLLGKAAQVLAKVVADM
ncbi:MAG: MarR family transcriptional regulator [Terracidiphilus sp.]|jgi:DNA-binding MarR family transcriptional regulator